jgi:hypothetical protein
LDPNDVWAIASAVVELLASEEVAMRARRWLSAGEVAAAFGRSPEWVRDHAAELGGRKIGGPRAPWRFPASCLAAAEDQAPPRPRDSVSQLRRRKSRSAVTLLPIRN